jgi:hypothetical protein
LISFISADSKVNLTAPQIPRPQTGGLFEAIGKRTFPGT